MWRASSVPMSTSAVVRASSTSSSFAPCACTSHCASSVRTLYGVGSGSSHSMRAARSVIDLDEDPRELVADWNVVLQAAIELADRGGLGLQRHQHELLLRARALEQRG